MQKFKNLDQFEKNLLPESTRCEHFCNKIDVPIGSINPRSIELHNIAVF